VTWAGRYRSEAKHDQNGNGTVSRAERAWRVARYRAGGMGLKRLAAEHNLRVAFWKASSGKRAKTGCRAFRVKLDETLDALRKELLTGRTAVGELP